MTQKLISLLILSLLLGSGCASLTDADKEAVRTINDTVVVLRAKNAIPAGTELSADDLETAEIPTAYLPPAPVFAGDIEEWEGTPLALSVEAGRILEGRDFMPVECVAVEAPVTPREASVISLADYVPKTSPSGNAKLTALAQGNNAFLAILELAAGESVPRHQDAAEEYLYILEGSGSLTINGKDHLIGPGSAVFMPADAEVSFKGDATKKLRAVQVFAGPESAAKYESWTAIAKEEAPAAKPK